MLTRTRLPIATGSIFSFIVTFCTLPFMTEPVLARTPNISGIWNSSEGEITFKQSASRVLATYKQDGGAIEGQISNNVLTGYWSENNSNRRCSTARNGRYHWGRLRFVFDGSTFKGAWGYCNDSPTKVWTGNRKNDDRPTTVSPDNQQTPSGISGIWNSSEGEITFKQSGTRVLATYTQDGGAIEGQISNNVLTGYWSEDNSNRRCNNARNGRYHWGRLNFVFDGSTFKGAWGYCDDEPTKVWTGNRKN
jgi:hypothetical protein